MTNRGGQRKPSPKKRYVKVQLSLSPKNKNRNASCRKLPPFPMLNRPYYVGGPVLLFKTLKKMLHSGKWTLGNPKLRQSRRELNNPAKLEAAWKISGLKYHRQPSILRSCHLWSSFMVTIESFLYLDHDIQKHSQLKRLRSSKTELHHLPFSKCSRHCCWRREFFEESWRQIASSELFRK